MRTRLQGRVWLFADDISTDHIISAKYLSSLDTKVFAEHAMEAVDPQFPKKVRPGDILVASNNFGCGSSREQAVLAFQALGISCILANTFARIFYRNAINVGFPVIECPGLHARLKEGDVLVVDLQGGNVTLPNGDAMAFHPIPPNVLEILEAGGLVPKLKRELASKPS